VVAKPDVVNIPSAAMLKTFVSARPLSQRG
jgi:hypothetical protein